MGRGSAVFIFDKICDALLGDKPVDKDETIRALIEVLEDNDWDTQQDSRYWEHPIVQKIMKERHPRWSCRGVNTHEV